MKEFCDWCHAPIDDGWGEITMRGTVGLMVLNDKNDLCAKCILLASRLVMEAREKTRRARPVSGVVADPEGLPGGRKA